MTILLPVLIKYISPNIYNKDSKFLKVFTNTNWCVCTFKFFIDVAYTWCERSSCTWNVNLNGECPVYIKCPQKQIKLLEGFAVGDSAPQPPVGTSPQTPFLNTSKWILFLIYNALNNNTFSQDSGAQFFFWLGGGRWLAAFWGWNPKCLISKCL